MIQDMKIPFSKPEFSALAVIKVAFFLVGGGVVQTGMAELGDDPRFQTMVKEIGLE